MVRLVFRPYTQFRRSICTSESLRTSIRVSPDFVLTRHSSPSFGSQRVCSWYAQPSEVSDVQEMRTPWPTNRKECQTKAMISPQIRNRTLYFHYAFGFTFPMTRIHVRLLGPCFKTGQADHACIRLQSTEQCQSNSYRQSASHSMLQLPVHTPHVHNSYKPSTATKRLFRMIK